MEIVSKGEPKSLVEACLWIDRAGSSELKNEKSVRTLLPSIYVNGGYENEDLLEYLAKNPSAMEFRTSETILHLASSIVDIVRTGARSGHQYQEADAEKLERLTPVRNRTPLWFESFVPQHNGWALVIGDDLKCAKPEEAGGWIRLFELARQGNAPKPSKAFLKTPGALRSEINGTGPRCEALGQEVPDSMASMEIEGKLDRFQQALLKFKANKNVKKRLTKAILIAGGSV